MIRVLGMYNFEGSLPLEKENLNEGGTLMKNKKWWDRFLHISLGLNSLPVSCAIVIKEFISIAIW